MGPAVDVRPLQRLQRRDVAGDVVSVAGVAQVHVLGLGKERMVSLGRFDGDVSPRDYSSHRDCLDACRDREIANGTDAKKAEFDRQMYEANGEQWEGRYGGAYGY